MIIYPKLVVLDVDGVLTDGTKQYVNGKPVSKSFSDKDFTAMKILKSKGSKVCFLTADAGNAALAKDRNIDCFVSRDAYNRINKKEAFQVVRKHYGLSANDVVWGVGDDVFDIEWLELCDKSFCPVDAAALVQSSVSVVLESYGGEGLVQEIVERFMLPITKQDIKLLVEIDSHEGWSHAAR
ncbi:MAG: hypothetical protein KOO63_04050 [Bacteroidales bacterium]|nr:hypothetical protein [Candidatus Latescibacterota bacterium]